MRNFPVNWSAWSHWLSVVDDWMNPLAANVAANPAGPWLVHESPVAVALGVPASSPRGQEMYLGAPTYGDFAQTEYTGWGFRMTLRLANTLGLCQLFLDGVSLLNSIDLSTGATTAGVDSIVPLTKIANNALVIQVPSVPLGRHRVKLMALNQPGAGSSTTTGPVLGQLVGAFTDSANSVIKPVQLGNAAALVAPAGATQLQLGVNDDKYFDETGSWVIAVNSTNYNVPGTSMPWLVTGSLNTAFPYGLQDGTAPVVVPVTAGSAVTVSYISGSVNPGNGTNYDANGVPGLSDFTADPTTGLRPAGFYMTTTTPGTHTDILFPAIEVMH